MTPPAVAHGTGTGAKYGSAGKTIKSMAASLFRAFDEGKLREQQPALGGSTPICPHLSPTPPPPLHPNPLPSPLYCHHVPLGAHDCLHKCLDQS